jgi:drug/metabolite transporter (DMT)-like permease
MSAKKPVWLIALALLGVYIFWGSTFLAIKYAVEALPPFLMGGTRFGIAGVILLAVALARGAAVPTPRQLLAAAKVGVPMSVGSSVLVVWAESIGIASAIAALASASMPVWLAVVDWLVYGNRIGWLQIAAVVMGVAGVVVLINPASAAIPLIPAVALFAGGGVWAIGALSSRSPRLPTDVTMINGLTQVTGALTLLAVGLLAGEPWHMGGYHLTLKSVLAVVFLTACGSLIAFSSYIWLLRSAPALVAGSHAFATPVVAMLLGVTMAGERITTGALMAAAVILLSVVLILLAPALARKAALAPAAAENWPKEVTEVS